MNDTLMANSTILVFANKQVCWFVCRGWLGSSRGLGWGLCSIINGPLMANSAILVFANKKSGYLAHVVWVALRAGLCGRAHCTAICTVYTAAAVALTTSCVSLPALQQLLLPIAQQHRRRIAVCFCN
jgi:hypothetical protein